MVKGMEIEKEDRIIEAAQEIFDIVEEKFKPRYTPSEFSGALAIYMANWNLGSPDPDKTAELWFKLVRLHMVHMKGRMPK